MRYNQYDTSKRDYYLSEFLDISQKFLVLVVHFLLNRYYKFPIEIEVTCGLSIPGNRGVNFYGK